MRRSCLFLMVFILVLACCNSSADSTRNRALLTDDGAGPIVDFCPWKDGFAVLGTEGVFEWLPESSELICLKSEKDMPDSIRQNLIQLFGTICVWNGEICITDSIDGSIWLLKDLSHPAFVFPEKDFVYDNPNGIMKKKILRSFSMGNEAWFLLNSFTFEKGNTNELYCLTWDGCFELYDEPALKDAFSAPEGILLQKTDGKNTIYTLLNAEREEKVIAAPTNETELIAGITFDVETESFFGVTENARILKDGKACSTLPFRMCSDGGKGIANSNTYVYLQDGSLIIRDLADDISKQIELRIMGIPDDEDLILKYQATHQSVTLVMDPRSEDFLGLQEAAISQDGDVDLFLVESDDIYTRLVKKGYVKPLNHSINLTRKANNFYPWLRNTVYSGDTLMAWPLSVDVDYWTINRTLWTYYGLGDYPATWQEMLALLTEWNDGRNFGNHPELCLLESVDGFQGIIEEVIHEYLLEYEQDGQLVDFDTPEFREILHLLWNYREDLGRTAGRMSLIMAYPQYLGTGQNDYDIVESFLPPALTEKSERLARASAQLLTINRASKHYKEALNFLEFVAEHTLPDMQYKMYRNMTTPMRYDDYEEEQARLTEEITLLKNQSEGDPEKIEEQIRLRQAAYERNEKEYWVVSPEDLIVWLPISSHITMPLETVYPDNSQTETKSFDSIIDRFSDGMITPDQMISELNSCAAMIYYENH